MAPLDRFLHSCAAEIERRAGLRSNRQAVLQTGARAFSEAVEAATPREHVRTDVPVTACLDRLRDGPLVSSLLASRGQLSWIASPRASDGGVERALAPLNEVRNLRDVTCGLMLLDARCEYPEHAHPPHEIYLPISGAGRWRYGGDPTLRELGDDALVYNPPRNIHAAWAGSDPLLALYVLWDELTLLPAPPDRSP